MTTIPDQVSSERQYRQMMNARLGEPVAQPAYTVATLPAAASWTGCTIYVSDGTSNKRLAVSDGTNWRWPDGNIVS